MIPDPIELRSLRYFIQVAEHLSFTAGARACGISQSALSQAIRQFEDRLGVPLFDRGDRRVILTAAGEELLVRARRILTETLEAEAAMRAFSGGKAGLLRIGVVQTFNVLVVPDIIAQLTSNNAESRFDVRELPAGLIEEEVAEGSLELGISFHPATKPSLQIEPLGEERLVLVQSTLRPVFTKGPAHPNEISKIPLALLQREFCTRALIDQSFSRVGITLEPSLEMNSISALLAVVSCHPSKYRDPSGVISLTPLFSKA